MANCSQVNNTTIKGTSTIAYDGTPLPCTDINTCDDLNTIISKFNTIICSVAADVDILTEDITNITEDVMLITEDIIDINNQLNICCPTTTTTSSSSTSTSTTTSTSSTTTTTTTQSPCNCITFVNGDALSQNIQYTNCLGVVQNTVIGPFATNSYCGCCGVAYSSLITITEGDVCVSEACPTTTTTSSSSTSTTTSTSTSTSTTTSTSTSSTTTTTTTLPEFCYAVEVYPPIFNPGTYHVVNYINCEGVFQELIIPDGGSMVTICPQQIISDNNNGVTNPLFTLCSV